MHRLVMHDGRMVDGRMVNNRAMDHMMHHRAAHGVVYDRMMDNGVMHHRMVLDFRDLLEMRFGRHRRRRGHGRSADKRRNGGGDGGKMTYAHNNPHVRWPKFLATELEVAQEKGADNRWIKVFS
ncbi:MAG TPA: hypothetical protein VL574_03705 [Stellaceae bacterium]|jgi:hypothetical protein|nr:hypothetical protein [Stellaceae bacterium]